MAQSVLRGTVALDGPSGTGKSTVARRLASELGAAYLDTGAMYRAVTLAALRDRVAVSDVEAVALAARSVDLEMGTDPGHPSVSLAGENVEHEIRGPAVTGSVSAVSAVPVVRELLVAEQRRLIRQSAEQPGGIVVEGRDIGTVVAPEAGLKVYLTASSHARAQRRTAQDAAFGHGTDLERTHADVRRRDNLDSSRESSPLRMAGDAVELDTTELDVPGVLAQLHKLIEQRGLLDREKRTIL
ncbi:cytidylate kinase [Halopolyspora algeriensis]|uniref:Cytidylate kinase n=1 Tax=Halopolyspora algeriensis TaxID=1500506 RepID=A0A368VYR2_9ACTN|nr:(d)CMP kinase [Halopolyspora algeriensis]RCW44714.1 cytidylate kinase [Halopolyspora algeriensis]TQM56071.1 cytidylate kinase [Halopolyspora algeriensis]